MLKKLESTRWFLVKKYYVLRATKIDEDKNQREIKKKTDLTPPMPEPDLEIVK
jgi:hypothetical protein